MIVLTDPLPGLSITTNDSRVVSACLGDVLHCTADGDQYPIVFGFQWFNSNDNNIANGSILNVTLSDTYYCTAYNVIRGNTYKIRSYLATAQYCGEFLFTASLAIGKLLSARRTSLQYILLVK